MKRSFIVAALAGIALVSLPCAARAQMSTVVKPLQFGVAAGVALPVSDLGDSYDIGFNGTVTVGFHPQLIPLGVRIDGFYNQFGAKAAGAGNAHIAGASGNLVYKFPSNVVAPYAIGGAGWYNTGVSGLASTNHFGWNIGGGITLPLSGFETFVEARYNQVQVKGGGSSKFIPITFGVMF